MIPATRDGMKRANYSGKGIGLQSFCSAMKSLKTGCVSKKHASLLSTGTHTIVTSLMELHIQCLCKVTDSCAFVWKDPAWVTAHLKTDLSKITRDAHPIRSREAATDRSLARKPVVFGQMKRQAP
jgi:hypothetical protein